MSLQSITSGKQEKPLRIVVYGVEGVGKSTLGASAPKPIFLGAEDGTSQIDVPRFPQPESWEDMLEAIRTLGREEHDYKTLVIDTLDWVEPLCWAYVCEKGKKESIEEFGYGKGYQAALDEWRKLYVALDALRASKKMQIILLAHSWVKAFKNPAGDDYDHYEMKLNAKAAGLAKEWADIVLFANYDVAVSKDERTKRVRGFDTGRRVVYTTHSAAWDAKNRHNLPAVLPLDWGEVESAIKDGSMKAERMKAEFIERATALGGIDIQKTVEWAAGNPALWAQALNKLSQREAAKVAA